MCRTNWRPWRLMWIISEENPKTCVSFTPDSIPILIQRFILYSPSLYHFNKTDKRVKFILISFDRKRLIDSIYSKLMWLSLILFPSSCIMLPMEIKSIIMIFRMEAIPWPNELICHLKCTLMRFDDMYLNQCLTLPWIIQINSKIYWLLILLIQIHSNNH